MIIWYFLSKCNFKINTMFDVVSELVGRVGLCFCRTAVSNWPIFYAVDDRGIIVEHCWSECWQGTTAVLRTSTCLRNTLSTTDPTWNAKRMNPVLRTLPVSYLVDTLVISVRPFWFYFAYPTNTCLCMCIYICSRPNPHYILCATI